MKTIFEEIQEDMDEFFAEIDAIIGREPEMTDEEAKYNKSHAIFTAFFPANAPRYAITTFIENGESGSKTAAPLAKEIIEKYQNW